MSLVLCSWWFTYLYLLYPSFSLLTPSSHRQVSFCSFRLCFVRFSLLSAWLDGFTSFEWFLVMHFVSPSSTRTSYSSLCYVDVWMTTLSSFLALRMSCSCPSYSWTSPTTTSDPWCSGPTSTSPASTTTSSTTRRAVDYAQPTTRYVSSPFLTLPPHVPSLAVVPLMFRVLSLVRRYPHSRSTACMHIVIQLTIIMNNIKEAMWRPVTQPLPTSTLSTNLSTRQLEVTFSFLPLRGVVLAFVSIFWCRCLTFLTLCPLGIAGKTTSPLAQLQQASYDPLQHAIQQYACQFVSSLPACFLPFSRSP